MTKRLRLFHFDIKTYGNYGDTLLFEAVRQTFNGFGDHGCFDVYDSRPLRDRVGPRLIDYINDTADAVVVGGGGLFLSDTNPNRRSGWQWNISLELLERLKKPLIIFAVGNNRFYGQDDFADPFRDHVNLTVEKSIFFGLRNHGSMRTIRSYLKPEAQDRIAFQPCPTTISSHLFGDLWQPEIEPRRHLAVESIVGKRQERVGFDAAAIYQAQARVLNRLAGEGWTLESQPFARADLGFQSALTEAEVPFTESRFFGRRGVLYSGIESFATLPAILGTRGHAQMVPFGMGAIPLSLDVHPKIGYFAADIGHPEWAVDPRADDFEETLYRLIHDVYQNQGTLRKELAETREGFYQTTLDNVAGIYAALTGETHAREFTPYTPFERRLAEHGFADSLERESSERKVTELRDTAAGLRTTLESTELNAAKPSAAEPSGLSAADLLTRSAGAARAGDYHTARQLRGAAAAVDAELVAGQRTPRWDRGVGRYVPGSILRCAKRLRSQ